MGILEAICSVIITIVIAMTILGVVVTIYDTKKLEEENERLREDLQKARARKLKSEYKKVEEK